MVELIEYFPPQVGAASKFLACKRKDVWAEKNVSGVQHQLSIDEGLRAMLQEMGERSRQKRVERANARLLEAKVIEH